MAGGLARRRSLGAGEMATSLAFALGTLPGMAAAHDPAATAVELKTNVTVTAVRGAKAPVDRLTLPIAEQPQAITEITREELERRGASTLNDALRNVAGLSLGAGETSFQGNNAILRGFTTRNDLFVDNARDYGYYFRDTFDDARIDVLKGPSAILFGRGATGGLIARKTRQPSLTSGAEAGFQAGLDDTLRATADFNVAGVLGRGSALRFAGVVHRSGVAARDGALFRRWAIAPKIAFGLDTPTRFILGYLHQEERNRPDYGIPWYAGTQADPGAPVPVARRSYYGFGNDRLNTDVNIVTGRIEHDVGAHTLLRAQPRYSNNLRDFRYSEAVLPAGTRRTTPITQIIVGRNLFQGTGHDIFLQGQVDLQTAFKIAGTQHHLVTGFEGAREGAEPIYVTNFNVPTTALTAPTNPFYADGTSSFVRLRAKTRSFSYSLFAIDTIELGPRWRAMIGLRWDSFSTRYTSTRFTASGAADRLTNVDRTDQKFSYRGALLYTPVPAVTLYVGYANSFNPSGEGIESLVSAGRSVAEANRDLAPETSFSIEAGAKWQVFGGRALLSGSLFRIEKDNARVANPDTPGFNSLGGRQRVDGIEIEFGGTPLPGWDVKLGYSLLDSRTLASAPGGPIIGAPLPITPRHSGFFSTAYNVTKRLNLGLNISAAADRLGQNTPALYLVAPGYAVLDLSARYRLTRSIDLSVTVNNVADTLYYDQLHPFHVIPGAGRTALAALKAVF